jgi:transposase InsO family protein
VKYAWIEQHQSEFQVGRMCEVLDVSRSGYYEWLDRPASAHHQEDRQLREQIACHFEQGRGTYGTRRIQRLLAENAQRVSRRRIGRLMNEAQLRCKTRKKFRPPSDSTPESRAAPNVLERRFEVTGPDRAYVGDITYVPTGEGWLYLAVVIDLFSRAVVGWSMAEHMHAELVEQALSRAIERRRPPRGLIMHTDRGSQYGANSYLGILNAYDIRPSMSRRGNCWDNAVAESFFHSLKTELIHLQTFENREQAQPVFVKRPDASQVVNKVLQLGRPGIDRC